MRPAFDRLALTVSCIALVCGMVAVGRAWGWWQSLIVFGAGIALSVGLFEITAPPDVKPQPRARGARENVFEDAE